MDNKSQDQRSSNMAAIKGKNTTPELYLRKLLFRKGYRYSLHSKKVPGHPDLYMPKYNLAIFVNGCFWHRHSGCKYAYTPKSRMDFWTEKFKRNVERDERVRQELMDAGIRRLVVWECAVRKMRKDPVFEEDCIKRIEEFIHSDEMNAEI